MDMLIPLLLLAAAPPATPGKPITGPTVNEQLLAAHNRERAAMKVAPLKWSATLAADAQLWAEKLARSNRFDHAKGTDNKADHGENLWMGTRGAYTPQEMVGSWIDEKRLFKAGLFPNNSTNGNWLDVGHYTQLIWHNSTEVGCAIVANRVDDYLVCRYNPPGNWMGQSPLGAAPTIRQRKASAKKPLNQ
jgi:hypothetical protein